MVVVDLVAAFVDLVMVVVDLVVAFVARAQQRRTLTSTTSTDFNFDNWS